VVLLNLPQIAESQASAYVTSNDADAVLEAALCEGKLDYDASLGDFSVSDEDFRNNWFHQVSGAAPSAVTATVPEIKRPFMVQNLCGENLTITTGTGDSFPILNGENRLLYCDGSNVLGLTDDTSTASLVPTFSGALTDISSNVTIPDGIATSITWDVPEYDTETYFDISNPSRFTIPIGVSKIILKGQVRWVSDLSDSREVLFLKNGSATYIGRAYCVHDAQSKLVMNLTSPPLDVTAGDYFELAAFQDSGSDQSAESDSSTWFSIQAVG